MSRPARIVFAGTPEFAVPALEALLVQGYGVAGVYTQPDRPAGRGRRLTPGPVKRAALAHGLPVYQPASLKGPDARAGLAALAPDLLVVVAYGLLLPRAVLELPARGCVNIHASLLPRWRGAAPIQRALLAGDTETGISIMQMEAGLDTGPVLRVRHCPIGPRDTGGSLHDRLAGLGAETLLEALPGILAGTAPRTVQDGSLATYARKLEKAEARIDWTRPAPELERLVRAFDPWPVAHTRYRGGSLRVWDAVARPGQGQPGRVLACGHAGIDVGCGTGVLRLLRLQLPGRRVLAPAELLTAHSFEGEDLG
jgi:methionyl-tRNA formyltransferase